MVISSHDPFIIVFQKVAKKIELLEDFTYYFALFFDKYDEASKSWQGCDLSKIFTNYDIVYHSNTILSTI